MSFGKRVATMRNLRGLTQHQVAERISISRSSLANIEAGRQECTLAHLRELAAALGVSMGQLLGEVPLPAAPEVVIVAEFRVRCLDCGPIASVDTATVANAHRQGHIEAHLRGVL